MNESPLPLKDIHIPQPIGWWLPAPGWWLLVIMIPLALWLLWWLYQALTRKTAVKAAKQMLQQIQQDNQQTDLQKLCAISVLLRRTAISCYPRPETAALTGSDWLRFLDRNLPGHPFSEGPGKILIEAPYQRNTDIEVPLDDLIRLCRDWLNSLPRRKR